MIVLGLILACVFGAGLVYLFFLKQIKTLENNATELSTKLQEKEKAEQEKTIIIKDLQSQNNALITDNARYEEKIKNIESQVLEKEKLINEKKNEILQIQERLKFEFEALSNKLLDEKSKKFTEQNQQILNNSIAPIKEYLNQAKELERKIQNYYDNENKDRTSLKTTIEELSRKSLEVSKNAENLAKALTSEVKTQGTWGEFILEKVLELSGLIKDMHYVVQYKEHDKQPDVIVNLPDNKCIIIDSKVTLNSYIQYTQANTSEEKDMYAKAVIDSIRSHIKNLSEKNYESLTSVYSIDYVLMFIPIETVMTVAVGKDTDLFGEAARKKILLVTPTSLLSTLKTIHFLWRQENRKKEFENILQDIERLYDKIRIFAEHMDKAEKALQTAVVSYEDAKKSLITGTGNAMSIIEKKIKPHIQPKKTMPPNWLPDNEN